MPVHQATTGADGGFAVQTLLSGPQPPELAPDATIAFGTPAAQQLTYRAGACQRTANVSLDALVTKPVDWFREQVVVLAADAVVLGETCGISGGPGTTIPPTDAAVETETNASDRNAALLSIAIAMAVIVVGVFVGSRGGIRRR
jgi:hypothetical protein